jgi:hypothetical protein
MVHSSGSERVATTIRLRVAVRKLELVWESLYGPGDSHLTLHADREDRAPMQLGTGHGNGQIERNVRIQKGSREVRRKGVGCQSGKMERGG